MAEEVVAAVVASEVEVARAAAEGRVGSRATKAGSRATKAVVRDLTAGPACMLLHALTSLPAAGQRVNCFGKYVPAAVAHFVAACTPRCPRDVAGSPSA